MFCNEAGEPNELGKDENGRAKPPRITLSVHKMTPIPSVELDDYTPDQTAVTNGEKPGESVETSSGLQLPVQKNLSWPEMSSGNQGRGILKKNSVVEWPAEMVEENPLEGETELAESSTGGAAAAGGVVGEVEPKKEILLGRTVKFDMPSFDSQTSDEIPEIIVEVVTEMTKAESNPEVLLSEEMKYIEPEDLSKDNACDESFGTDMSDTVKEVIRLVKEIEENGTNEEEEKEEDKEVKQLRQQRKRLRLELKVILRAILRNNFALMKQGVDLQVEALDGDEDEEEEEEDEEEKDDEEAG